MRDSPAMELITKSCRNILISLVNATRSVFPWEGMILTGFLHWNQDPSRWWVLWLTSATVKADFGQQLPWQNDLEIWKVHRFTCNSPAILLCVSQAFFQHLVQSNDSALPQPKLSISAWPHLLRTQTLVVELSLCRLYHWCKKIPVWWRNADFWRSNDSSGNSTAITPDKHSTTHTCRNLAVCHSLIQRWDVALSISVASNGNSTAITADKHCVRSACRNLDVCHALLQRWDVALSMRIISDGNSTAITPEKHCMIGTSRNLGPVKLLSELPPNEQRTWTGTKQVSALTQSTGHKNPEHSTRDPPVINPKQKGENKATQKKRT